MLDILISGPGGESARCRLSSSAIWIGRDPECDIVLDDLDISRRHALLRRGAQVWEIVDQSANGTNVGGRHLHRAAVELGKQETICVGPYSLSLTQAQERSGPTSSVPDSTPLAASSLRRRIHARLLDSLNLSRIDGSDVNRAEMRPRVLEALGHIVMELASEIPGRVDRQRLIRELADEALGLGPLEALLADESVTEIMVVDPFTIFCERSGKLEKTNLRFSDDEAARSCIERIVTPLGRRIDESTPYVDARLSDGSRVNAIIPPLALRGACVTIRRFGRHRFDLDDLLRREALSAAMARFLTRSIVARKNVLIAGGTGSGKTTLLNALASAIPSRERIVTIEDAAELRLEQGHVVSLESRPPNMEGEGAVTIRDLVRNALRMRPDRIIVGECRGGEALDMLQAMNTGHSGSMTTLHANSPREALARMETLTLMAAIGLPSHAVRQQIAASLDIIVQVARLSDGSRRVTSIAEVLGVADDGTVEVRELFSFVITGVGEEMKVLGRFRASGYLPTYAEDLVRNGLASCGDVL